MIFLKPSLLIALAALCVGCGGGGSDSNSNNAGASNISLDNVNTVFRESFTRLESGLGIADALIDIILPLTLTPGATTDFSASCSSGSNFTEYQSTTSAYEPGDIVIDSFSACVIGGIRLDGVVTTSFGAGTAPGSNLYNGIVTLNELRVQDGTFTMGIRGSLSFSINDSDLSFTYSDSPQAGDASFEVGFGPAGNEFSTSSAFDITTVRRFSNQLTLDIDASYFSSTLNQRVTIDTSPQLSASAANEWPTFGGIRIQAGSSFVELEALEEFLNLSFAIFNLNVNGSVPSAPNPDPNPDPLAPSLIFNDVRWDEISTGFLIPFGN